MDFDQMKMIWDSQNEEPLYAVNETALHAMVRRRGEQLHRCAARCHLFEIVSGTAFGAGMFVLAGILAWGDPAWLISLSWINVPVTGGDAAMLGLSGTIWFYYAAYMWGARRRQLRREEDFASSLRGDLDRALSHVEFQIRMARSIVWWGLVPCCLGAYLCIVVLFHLKDADPTHLAWSGLIMLVALALSIWCQHRAITRRFEPRRRELASLRAKLADQQR